MLYLLGFFVISANAAFDAEVHSKYTTLSREEFVEYFNSLNLTWKAKIYDDNYNHDCTYIDTNITFPTITHDVGDLNIPDSFDARAQWPQCPSIAKIFNQGHCGSCWTFGAAGTASDRTCIHANINVELSEQDFSCCTKCFESTVCNGGDPAQAFQFWIDSGLVTANCMPYDIPALKDNNACTKTCMNGAGYSSDKHFGGRVYSVSSDEDQIKAELIKNGPIEVGMQTYTDLQDYSHGVYVHKYGAKSAKHSVRLIGYGEENNMKYWLVANSWGTTKGENGLIKIKQYQPELEFENHLLAVTPKGH